MKHIKKFENIIVKTEFKIFEKNLYEPKVGDYVLLDVLEMMSHNTEMDYNIYECTPTDNLGYLVDIDKSKSTYIYLIKFYDDKDIWVRKSEILRKLTPNEIDEFNSKIAAKNYNL